jgi:hypothetical protein
VCARNAAGNCTPPSNIVIIQPPVGTSTNSFTLNGVQWPKVNGLVDYVVFISDTDDLIHAEPGNAATGTLTAGTDPTTYTPTSITFAGAVSRTNWAIPNPNIQNVRIKTKTLVHGGVLGAQIDAVSGSTVQADWVIDLVGTDDWTGRILSIIGREDSSVPFLSYNILGFDRTTGIFTLDRSASDVQVGDAFCVSFKGYDNSSNPYVFADSGCENVANYGADHTPTPYSGLTPHIEQGYILRVLAGTNRGQTAKVVDNDTTSYTLDRPFPIDATSVVIVESAGWEFSSDSSTVTNAVWSTPSTVQIAATNQQGYHVQINLLVGGFTVDNNGNESEDGDGPFRMVYLFGSSDTRIVTS